MVVQGRGKQERCTCGNGGSDGGGGGDGCDVGLTFVFLLGG